MAQPRHIVIFSITVLAFILRLYRLDNQSYWIDEAWTVYYANLSLTELWHWLTHFEIKPPFYLPSTIGWVQIFGDSEFALRFYSAIFGTIAIPLTYQLGKIMGDIRVGLIAAFLMSLAPFQIWHSQEARLYTILTTAALISMISFVRLNQRFCYTTKQPQNKSTPYLFILYLLYVLATTWAITVHYHAVVLIGIQGLFLLVTGKQQWRFYGVWATLVMLILLLLIPWLIFGFTFLQGYQNWVPQPTFSEAFSRSLTTYSVGHLLPREQSIPLSLPFLAAYLIGLMYATRRRWRAWSGGMMLVYLLAFTIAPILVAWLYGELRTTVYLERYLIFIQLGYLLTIAIGIIGIYDFTNERLSHWLTKQINNPVKKTVPFILPSLLVLLLASINLYSLSEYYDNPVYAKENWRGITEIISTYAQAEDGILLTGDGGEHAFNFYYQDDLPVYYPFNLALDKPGIPRLEGPAALEKLATIATHHEQLWYTPYGMYLDPLLEEWLMHQAFPAWQSWLGTKRLALYANPNTPTPRISTIQQQLTDELAISTIHLPHKPVMANRVLPLKIRWQLANQPTQEYRLSLRLINQTGDIFTQNDWPSLKGKLEVANEELENKASHVLTTTHGIWIPVDVPPGIYNLQVVVYDGVTGQGIGQPMLIPEVIVAGASITPPSHMLTIPNPVAVSLGNLKVVGYSVPAEHQPGQTMWAWLYWQCITACDRLIDHQIQLQLGQEKGLPMYQQPITHSLGTLKDWQPGQVRRAIYHLPTSPRLNSGQAPLIISLVSSNDQVDQEEILVDIALQNRPRQFEPPSISRSLAIPFGEPPQLTLLGYDLAEPNEEYLSVTLYWQALMEMDRNYTVFVQLLDSTGTVVRQRDMPPLDGQAPTTTWVTNEYLTDLHPLDIISLPPGHYQLIVGLYNPITDTRLSLDTGTDFVVLTEINLNSP